jgi:hypothetical protein
VDLVRRERVTFAMSRNEENGLVFAPRF